MELSALTERWIVRLTWITAWLGLVGGQLHALARHATPDGRGDLDQSPLTSLWSRPASEALSPLLWADPHTVYVTYGKLWLPVCMAFTLCAFVVRAHREPVGAEEWGWRLVLTAHVLMTLSVIGDYFTPWLDESFMFVGMPSAALTLVGAPLLGVALLRRGFRPRITAWLLILWLPSLLAVTQVTSLGSAMLPLAFGWALAGSRVVRGRASTLSDAKLARPAPAPA